eukprot:1192310-Prorocentrum_minimum.AAC.1
MRAIGSRPGYVLPRCARLARGSGMFSLNARDWLAFRVYSRIPHVACGAAYCGRRENRPGTRGNRARRGRNITRYPACAA